MADEAKSAPDIEFRSQRLSIVVYRYVPEDIDASAAKEYLSELNTEILRRMQTEGEVFVSNALIDDDYLLRACIVNFRTTLDDAQAAISVAQKLGKEVDAELRPDSLK